MGGTKVYAGSAAPVSTAQESGVWVDGAKATNPSSGQSLADTGPLPEGDYLFGFMLHATVDAVFEARQRNAADGANVHAKEIPVPANNLIEPIFPSKIAIAEGERMRVANVTGFTGSAQASIFYAKVIG